MTEKDKIELMRRFEPFGREIPKDQVMSVIARIPAESSDLISRQAATSIPILPKEHRKVFKGEDDAFETGWNEALACVNMLPSDDRPKGESLLGAEMSLSKWIPVSERLPSEKKAVLICDSRGNRFVGKLILTDTGYKWGIPIFVVWVDIEDGDAWMPLPEPYKGGEDE